MAVQKAVELTGTGTTVEDAIGEALDRAQLTLEGITRFQVREVSGVLDDDGQVTYQVELRVWFTLLERLHG